MKRSTRTSTSSKANPVQYRLETVKREGLFVVSWDGRGFCVEIGDHDIDDLFDLAKRSIKRDLENRKEENASTKKRNRKSSPSVSS